MSKITYQYFNLSLLFNRVLMSSLDEAFGMNNKASMAGSRIILSNPADSRGFSVLSTPMRVVFEENGGQLGIEIPRQASELSIIWKLNCLMIYINTF